MTDFDSWYNSRPFARVVETNVVKHAKKLNLKAAFNDGREGGIIEGLQKAIQIIQAGDRGLPRTWEDDIAAIQDEIDKRDAITIPDFLRRGSD